jgi:glycosyltransferase involved in cell wall biosynthesis
MKKSPKITIKSNCTLSIVVPVYRSAEILPKLVEEILSEISKIELQNDFELLLICDGSGDDSWHVIKRLARLHPFVRGTLLRRNYGQHNAIMVGLQQCLGAVIVIMDDDLQHSPKYIPSFLEAINEGFDVCYSRFGSVKQKKWKIFGSKFNNLIANFLLDKPKDLYLSPFKAISRNICNLIICYDGPYPYVDGLILLHTDSINVIDVEHQERYCGKSNYSFRKSLSLWIMMATGFSVKPLRLATFFGFYISIAAFLFIIYLIMSKLLFDIDVKGWTSLAVISLFMGGVQLIALGIIGEYMGRSYLKLNGKPQAIIKDNTEIDLRRYR